MPDLPFKHLSQLRKSIKDYGRKAFEKDDSKPLKDDEVEKIRQAFYKFFVNLFRYYPDKKQQKEWNKEPEESKESKKGQIPSISQD